MTNKKVARLDIPVGDTELIEICETLDAAQADLNDLAFKCFRSELNIICGALHFE